LGSMNVGIKMDNAEEIMAIRFPLSITSLVPKSVDSDAPLCTCAAQSQPGSKGASPTRQQ
jgi:hypothetical protein